MEPSLPGSGPNPTAFCDVCEEYHEKRPLNRAERLYIDHPQLPDEVIPGLYISKYEYL